MYKSLQPYLQNALLYHAFVYKSVVYPKNLDTFTSEEFNTFFKENFDTYVHDLPEEIKNK